MSIMIKKASLFISKEHCQLKTLKTVLHPYSWEVITQSNFTRSKVSFYTRLKE
jgi:hypothetical protein